jgi:hypothetical protein
VVHRLAAQELANARPEHRTAVREARVRGWAGALELQELVRAVHVDELAERDRSAIAELARPRPELVAAVRHRERAGRVGNAVAAEDLGELAARGPVGVEAELRDELG